MRIEAQNFERATPLGAGGKEKSEVCRMSSTEEPKVTEDSPPQEASAEEGKAAEPEKQETAPEPAVAPDAKTEELQSEEAAQPEPQPEEAKKEEEEVVEDDEEEPDDGVPRVLVTGASGFIASQLVKVLLEDGRFRVRGTVRSLKNQKKVQPLRDLVPDAKYPLRLVQADLVKAESWKKAAATCSYVFHLASPFPPPSSSITDDNIVPIAVKGTTNVLQACADAGTVKRVILTSSVAAISCGLVGSPDKPADHVYTEADWSLESACAPYEKSKLKAEQAAWEFVKKLDEDKRFELVVMNPAYVQGPLLSLASGEASMALAQGILGKKMPALPDLFFPIVDVRDVVKAQIAAMEKPEAVGNRYALVTETVHIKDIAQIIAAEFKPQGYKPTTGSMPKPIMWFFKFFDQQAKSIYPNLGKKVTFNNEKMVGGLGVTPFAVKDTIIDMCYSIIELGAITKNPGYLGHPSKRPTPPAKEEPAPAAEPESQTPGEPKAEPEPETPAEPKAEPEPETPAEPKAEPEPEAPAEPKAEPEPETPAEPPKAEPEPETPAEPEPETPAEPKTEPESETPAAEAQ